MIEFIKKLGLAVLISISAGVGVTAVIVLALAVERVPGFVLENVIMYGGFCMAWLLLLMALKLFEQSIAYTVRSFRRIRS